MLPTKRMIQHGMKVSSFTCCDNLFLPTIVSDIRLFSPSTTSDSLCDADSDNKGSASFNATHKKDDSAWNKGIIIYML